MLNIKLDVVEGIDTFEVEGGFVDLFAEATFVISQIYKQMHKGNPKVANAFKEAVQIAIRGDDNPVWATDKSMPGTVIMMPRIKKEES